MESKAAEASGKSAEQRRAERRQKAVIGERRVLGVFANCLLLLRDDYLFITKNPNVVLRATSRFLLANPWSRR